MIQLNDSVSGIKLDYLSTLTGDTSITIDDANPEKRAELATHVTELLRLGYQVFVQKNDETFKVKGYDADENEWIVIRHKDKQKVKAAGTTATTVPHRAGG